MVDITLELLGQRIQMLIDEVRNMRAELTAMRSEIDGGFHMMAGANAQVDGLRRIVDAHGQRITALEKQR